MQFLGIHDNFSSRGLLFFVHSIFEHLLKRSFPPFGVLCNAQTHVIHSRFIVINIVFQVQKITMANLRILHLILRKINLKTYVQIRLNFLLGLILLRLFVNFRFVLKIRLLRFCFRLHIRFNFFLNGLIVRDSGHIELRY